MPDFITHVALPMDKDGSGKTVQNRGKLKHLTIDRPGQKAAFNSSTNYWHLKTTDLNVPEADPANKLPELEPSQPFSSKLKQAGLSNNGDTNHVR